MEVIPAILETNIEDFKTTLENLLSHYSHFSVDIEDGVFVKGKTVQIETITNYFRDLKHSEELRSRLSFDFDLMVDDYNSELEKIDSFAGLVKVKTIFLHQKAVITHNKYLEICKLYPDFEIGIAIDFDDSVELLSSNFDLQNIPAIQIMSVKPGSQGSTFIEDMLNKIEQLRMSDYRNKISLDGGINEKTLKTILARKEMPDILYIGSYLTKTNQVEERAKHLQISLMSTRPS